MSYVYLDHYKCLYAQWLKMHLNSGIAPESGERIVSLPTFEALITATAVIDGGSNLTCYCKGWGKLVYHGYEVCIIPKDFVFVLTILVVDNPLR